MDLSSILNIVSIGFSLVGLLIDIKTNNIKVLKYSFGITILILMGINITSNMVFSHKINVIHSTNEAFKRELDKYEADLQELHQEYVKAERNIINLRSEIMRNLSNKELIIDRARECAIAVTELKKQRNASMALIRNGKNTIIQYYTDLSLWADTEILEFHLSLFEKLENSLIEMEPVVNLLEDNVVDILRIAREDISRTSESKIHEALDILERGGLE